MNSGPKLWNLAARPGPGVERRMENVTADMILGFPLSLLALNTILGRFKSYCFLCLIDNPAEVQQLVANYLLG